MPQMEREGGQAIDEHTCAWMHPMRPLRSVMGSCRCSKASGRRPTFFRVSPVRQAVIKWQRAVNGQRSRWVGSSGGSVGRSVLGDRADATPLLSPLHRLMRNCSREMSRIRPRLLASASWRKPSNTIFQVCAPSGRLDRYADVVQALETAARQRRSCSRSRVSHRERQAPPAPGIILGSPI